MYALDPIGMFAEVRVMTTKAAILAEGGRDVDALEDVNEYFDKSIIKDQFELAMRMAEVSRSTSEWHRRMTAENLGQSGQLVNLDIVVALYLWPASSFERGASDS
jgi:hypothetical protein